MKHHTKKLAALFLALFVTLAGFSALAETAVYGKTLQSEFSLAFDAGQLNALFAALAGEEAPDEAFKEGLNTIVDAIRKSKLTLVSGEGFVTLELATELDTLFDLQVAAREGSEHAIITTSLLPGVGLQIPASELQKGLETVLPAETSPERARSYAEAIGSYFANNQPAGFVSEQGAYEVADAGAFSQRTSFDIDTKMVAGLLKAILDVFRQDSQGRDIMTVLLTSAASQTEADAAAAGVEAPDQPENAEEFIAQAEAFIAQLEAAENTVIGHLTVHEDAARKANLTEITLNNEETGRPQFYLGSLSEDGDNGVDHLSRLNIIVDVPSAGEETNVEVDWASIRHGIIGGTNKDDLMVSLYSEVSLAAAEQMELHSSDITIHSAEGPISLSQSKTVATTPDQKTTGTVSLAAFSTEPLVTLHFDTVRLADGDVEAFPALEGLALINIGDGVDEQEDAQLSQNLLTEGLPALLVNLAQSLPDEMEDLLSILTALEMTEATP